MMTPCLLYYILQTENSYYSSRALFPLTALGMLFEMIMMMMMMMTIYLWNISFSTGQCFDKIHLILLK